MEHSQLIGLIREIRSNIESNQAIKEMYSTLPSISKAKRDIIEAGIKVYEESALRVIDVAQLDLTLSGAKYLVLEKQLKDLKDLLEIEDQLAKGEIPF